MESYSLSLPVHPPIRKTLPVKAKDYLVWIHRTLPCVVPGCENKDIHAHHLLQKKRTGNWATDLCCIPLCGEHHNLGNHSIHTLGDAGFEKHHHLNLFVCMLETFAEYIHMDDCFELEIVQLMERIYST